MHNSSRHRRLAAATAGLAVAVATLTACGSGQQAQTAQQSGESATSSTAPASSSSTAPSPAADTSTPGSAEQSPTAGSSPATPVPLAGAGTCENRPADPQEYADVFVRAWGSGDHATMDCLAAPDAVRYAEAYQPALGPGWTRLRSTGDQHTALVEYGSPNHKTIAQVTVTGAPGPTLPQHAITAIRIG